MFIDLNSDVGESYGNYIYGNDEENMAYLSSVNVACGLHAGDPLVMRETVELATMFVEGSRGAAVGRVCRRAGTPDFVGVSNSITVRLQQDWITRYGKVPNCSLQDRRPTTSPKMLS